MRVHVRVGGVVQGVGFRPFVHRLARRHGIGGFVRNDAAGVVIEAEGDRRALDALLAELRSEAPPLARVESVRSVPMESLGESGFAIAPSRPAPGPAVAMVPPDVATCGDCLRELFDPADRRHRHPFINCTNCGPRFTIVRRTPYDRANTTMAGFEMCGECRAEYEDPGDRRFHAEPIACPACGPRLSLPVEDAVALLREGAILAVKGIGGYHLACDAAGEEVTARLRAAKDREHKPFAVMCSDPTALAQVDRRERALLEGPERPIVLLRRRAGAAIAPSVAPGTGWLGVMLPYSPLHHLLLDGFGGPLVMTSGNRSSEPIAIDPDDAHRRLAGIADAFCEHDRPIHRRCEDSVVRAAFPVRRSRGHAPRPLGLPIASREPVVAVGAHLAATFCVARDAEAFLSPHLGDLDTPDALRSFDRDLSLYLDMLGVVPTVVAHDLHPEYLSTKWAQDRAGMEPFAVQHHHAHAAACLAEHGETGEALALVFDGTGLGTDGTLWGGELLRCDLEGFERVAHLDPVPLPGGEAAIREPWRTAAVYLEAAERPVPFERWEVVRQSLGVNAPLSSGMGRLFDAVAALLGVCSRTTYEGQPAIELEQLAGDVAAAPYPCRVAGGRIAGADLVRAAHDDLVAGRPAADIAAAFHEGVAAAGADACVQSRGPRTVVLSGGCFQNLRLLRSATRRLQDAGFSVRSHRRVPPGDGGISYGQAAVAAARAAAGRASCA